MSALLFTICVEILDEKVRNSMTLAGFNFGYPQKPIKLNEYAADGIMFLNKRTELCSALGILRDFGRVSGLKLNIEKCEGFWLGKDKKLQYNYKLFCIKWPSIFRCLGIYLGYNRQLNETKNWDEKIQDIKNTLKIWEKRDLTLFGRMQVLKTFALYKLVLPATILNLPKHIVKKVNKIFYRFLWRSTEKVKRVKVNQ